MRLSTSTNIYFRRPDGTMASIEQSIEKCAEAGYECIDLNFLDCTTFKLPFTGSNWEHWLWSVAETVENTKITVNQAHAPFYNFCDDNYENKEYMDKLIYRSVDCSSKLGIPWLVIHAGTDYNNAYTLSSSRKKNREYLLPLIEYAEKRNVGIAIENLWEYNIAPKRRYTTSIEELVELIDSFDSPSVGACYDTDHIFLSKLNHTESLLAIGSRLKATHISDCINIDSDHYLPFFGNSNWSEIMSALKRINYCGDLTFEMHRLCQNVPEELVLNTIKYSVDIGNYLISLFK